MIIQMQQFNSCFPIKASSRPTSTSPLTSCLLQILVADDTDHRLKTTKLAGVFNFANKLFTADDIPVEVEYEQDAISQFPVADIEITPAGLLFVLGSKHTACLAPDKCGIGIPSTSQKGCGTNTGCC